MSGRPGGTSGGGTSRNQRGARYQHGLRRQRASGAGLDERMDADELSDLKESIQYGQDYAKRGLGDISRPTTPSDLAEIFGPRKNLQQRAQRPENMQYTTPEWNSYIAERRLKNLPPDRTTLGGTVKDTFYTRDGDARSISGVWDKMFGDEEAEMNKTSDTFNSIRDTHRQSELTREFQEYQNHRTRQLSNDVLHKEELDALRRNAADDEIAYKLEQARNDYNRGKDKNFQNFSSIPELDDEAQNDVTENGIRSYLQPRSVHSFRDSQIYQQFSFARNLYDLATTDWSQNLHQAQNLKVITKLDEQRAIKKSAHDVRESVKELTPDSLSQLFQYDSGEYSYDEERRRIDLYFRQQYALLEDLSDQGILEVPLLSDSSREQALNTMNHHLATNIIPQVLLSDPSKSNPFLTPLEVGLNTFTGGTSPGALGTFGIRPNGASSTPLSDDTFLSATLPTTESLEYRIRHLLTIEKQGTLNPYQRQLLESLEHLQRQTGNINIPDNQIDSILRDYSNKNNGTGRGQTTGWFSSLFKSSSPSKNQNINNNNNNNNDPFELLQTVLAPAFLSTNHHSTDDNNSNSSTDNNNNNTTGKLIEPTWLSSLTNKLWGSDFSKSVQNLARNDAHQFVAELSQHELTKHHQNALQQAQNETLLNKPIEKSGKNGQNSDVFGKSARELAAEHMKALNNGTYYNTNTPKSKLLDQLAQLQELLRHPDIPPQVKGQLKIYQQQAFLAYYQIDRDEKNGKFDQEYLKQRQDERLLGQWLGDRQRQLGAERFSVGWNPSHSTNGEGFIGYKSGGGGSNNQEHNPSSSSSSTIQPESDFATQRLARREVERDILSRIGQGFGMTYSTQPTSSTGNNSRLALNHTTLAVSSYPYLDQVSNDGLAMRPGDRLDQEVHGGGGDHHYQPNTKQIKTFTPAPQANNAQFRPVYNYTPPPIHPVKRRFDIDNTIMTQDITSLTTGNNKSHKHQPLFHPCTQYEDLFRHCVLDNNNNIVPCRKQYKTYQICIADHPNNSKDLDHPSPISPYYVSPDLVKQSVAYPRRPNTLVDQFVLDTTFKID